jgi:hypothetical protein
MQVNPLMNETQAGLARTEGYGSWFLRLTRIAQPIKNCIRTWNSSGFPRALRID